MVVNPVLTSPRLKKPSGADFEPRNVRRCKELASSTEAESVVEVVVVGVGLEEAVWQVLPKLLSVPVPDVADAIIRLVSELDGKTARMTSFVRLCHLTSIGPK